MELSELDQQEQQLIKQLNEIKIKKLEIQRKQIADKKCNIRNQIELLEEELRQLNNEDSNLHSDILKLY